MVTFARVSLSQVLAWYIIHIQEIDLIRTFEFVYIFAEVL